MRYQSIKSKVGNHLNSGGIPLDGISAPICVAGLYFRCLASSHYLAAKEAQTRRPMVIMKKKLLSCNTDILINASWHTIMLQLPINQYQLVIELRDSYE